MSYNNMLGQALEALQQGDLDNAERLCRTILQTAPTHADTLNILGLVAQMSGRCKEASDLFYKAIAQTPEFAPYYFNLGASLEGLEAIEAYEKALKYGYDDASDVYNRIGEVYKHLGKVQEQKEYYIKALRCNPKDHEAQANLAFANKDIHELKRIDDALARYYLALIYFEDGELELALEFATKALRYDQLNETVNVLVGVIYLKKGDEDNARVFFGKALLVNGKNVDALVNLANLDAKRGCYKEAEEKYAAVINVDQRNVDARINYGALLYRQGRSLEALNQYQEAAIINPNSPEVSNNIAAIVSERGDYLQAIDMFFNALIKDQDNKTYAINIVENLMKLAEKNKKEALRIAEQWRQSMPENVFANYIYSVLNGENCDNMAYNEMLFDEFAENYEEVLERIKYNVPLKMRELLGNVEGKILDLGCGSGLVGEILKNEHNHIVGIDVSQKMLDLACKKQVYDKLVKADVVNFLEENNDFDLIIAADVVGYIGDLEKIISLCEGKKLCFSVELCDEGFRLGETGRYQHSEKYVAALLDQYGFKNVSKTLLVLRLENNRPVNGMIFTAN